MKTTNRIPEHLLNQAKEKANSVIEQTFQDLNEGTHRNYDEAEEHLAMMIGDALTDLDPCDDSYDQVQIAGLLLAAATVHEANPEKE